MYNIEEFSKKIKSVRIAYHLSLAEMTNLLAMKSRGPLYAWEEGKADRKSTRLNSSHTS